MKTYTHTETKTKPLLVIGIDSYATSPREWTNIGFFITCDSNYHSPDRNLVLEKIVKDKGQEAITQEDHIQMIREAIEEETEDKVIAIFPISKYEHSGVSYSLGNSYGFDYSRNGFYIITNFSLKDYHHPQEARPEEKDFKEIIQKELEIFNKYCNGEVYDYILYNEQGETEDTCSGFYSLEDIKDQLPEEWKNEDLSEYLN